MSASTTFIYRMVHWQNVAWILQNGMCCQAHPLADPNYINIGMEKLIHDRRHNPIPIQGAGDLGDYVPFYFAGHSPMLLMIKNGTKGVMQRPQEDIVFVVCSIQKIVDLGLPFVFTDRHAKRAMANFYTDIADLNQLDWNAIGAKVWKNDANHLQRQDLKQAEFLVKSQVPVEAISALVVKDVERKAYFNELTAQLNLTIKVHIDHQKKLYY